MRDQVTLHIQPSFDNDSYERVIVEVDESMSMRQVLEAGGTSGFAAYMPMLPGDENTMDADEDRLIWHDGNLFGLTRAGLLTSAYSATWADFVRGAEAGFLDGDPRELLVYADRGAAGGGAVELIEAWNWLWANHEQVLFAKELAEVAATVLGGAVKATLELPKARRRALGRDFVKRGITTRALMAFIDNTALWDPKRLATVLGVTEAEAGAALRQVGYDSDEHGLYRLSDAPEARLRRSATYANIHGSPDDLDEKRELYGPIQVPRWWDAPSEDEDDDGDEQPTTSSR